MKGIFEEELDKNTVGVIGNDGVFYLRNKNEIQRLHSYFYDLTFNRINFTNSKSLTKRRSLNKLEKAESENSPKFRPKINQVSKTIEDLRSNDFRDIPRHDLLISKGQEYKMNVTQKAKEKQSKELEGCSFKPAFKQNVRGARNSSNKMTSESNFSIEEIKSMLKENLDSSAPLPVMAKGKSRKTNLKPKINHIIMDLNQGKDLVIHSSEIVEEYNALHKHQTQSESQQSSGAADRLKQAKQFYRAISDLPQAEEQSYDANNRFL